MTEAITVTENTRYPLRAVAIKNFLGIKSLEHRFKGRLTAVTGENATGKSSFATALRGAVASDPDPMSLGERQLKKYAHNGSDKCAVQVELQNDDVRRNWEPTSRKISGSVSCPQRPIVIGLTRPFELRTDKEVNEFWDDVVVVKIDKQQVIKHCKDQLKSYPGTVANNISAIIDEYMTNFPEGECNREDIRKFHGKLKSARTTTMANFNAIKHTSVPGNVKGSNIMGYLKFDIPIEYDGSTYNDVKVERDKLADDLNNKYYISDANETEKYRENKRNWDHWEKELKERTEKLEQTKEIYSVKVKQDDKRLGNLKEFIETSLKAVEKARAENIVSSLPMECPECNTLLSVDPEQQILVRQDKSKSIKEEKRMQLIAELERKRAEAENDISHLLEVSKKNDEELNRAKRAVDEAKQKCEIYKEIISNKTTLSPTQNDGERTAITMSDYTRKVKKLDDLWGVINNLKDRHTATIQSYKVQALDMLMSILDPGGVAARQRERGFLFIQGVLKTLETTAQSTFGKVTINNDGRILIGGHPHALASKSERVWANWLIQCTFAFLYAKKVAAQLLVVDEVDIFDPGQEKSFVKTVDHVLNNVPLSQVVAVGTLIDKHSWDTAYVPDLVRL